MTVPPAILDLKIAPSYRRPIHLWLPLFLLWPLFLVLGVVVLVFTILADVVLLLLRERYHHYTLLLLGSVVALCATRGLVVRVKDERTNVSMTFQ